jgi:hypothetical protein
MRRTGVLALLSYQLFEIYFNSAEIALARPPWDIAFRIEWNEFRDTVSLQVQIHAIRSAE